MSDLNQNDGRQFDGFKKTGIDNEIENRLEQHCAKYKIPPLDAVKLFPVLARRQWTKRYLAHYQLFLKTLETPGDIAELGVFRGLGLMTWANFLEAHCIGDRTKMVYGFDNWTGFTEIDQKDGQNYEQSHKIQGGFSPAEFKNELESAIEIFDADRFVGWKERINLVEGNIEETVFKFVEDNPGVRFSLIHFDCDLYGPTKAALEALYPILSKGGVIMFDEYAIKEWPGETRAVDEYFAGKSIEIKTLGWTNAPAGYLIKE